jgi:endonuclease/exonuclease/phosphatase family metal-dependent hydrolase
MTLAKIVGVALALGVAGCATAASEPALTVLTYNIHHAAGVDGKLDLERIARVVESAKADVVCLQEMDRNLPRTNQEDFPAWFEKRLGMKAVFGCNYRFDGGEYGVATLTKLPIVSSENTALPNPKKVESRGCLRVMLKWEGGEVDVFNTHLGLKGPEREEQAAAVVKLMDAKRLVILAGDMNEGVDAPALKQFLALLRDALTSPDGPKDAKRIDHILVSDAFAVVEGRVLENEETRVASDHLPRVATVRER